MPPVRFVTTCLAAFLVISTHAAAQEKTAASEPDGWKATALQTATIDPQQDEPCTNGQAGQFSCHNIDLQAYLPIEMIGGRVVDGKLVTKLNDIWGWTDPQTDREYAIVGRNDGTSFVDVTDPANPVYLGDLPSHDGLSSTWRDVKTIDHFAVIVADNINHGMQVLDLHELRNVTNPPAVFSPSAHYLGFQQAHNVVVNTESGFGYAVGGDQCRGLLSFDLSDPLNPTGAGCYIDVRSGYGGTGYTHDAQCVMYNGPDEEYVGREICFASNESHVLIADLTSKEEPSTISLAQYPNVAYAHQGWLTEDHRYFLQDDELDELYTEGLKETRTLIWDVTDLDDPQLARIYHGTATSIDHNQYVVKDRSFQANYTSGLRILNISDPANPVEVGYFDTYPVDDSVGFSGAWSNYPFFESGNVVVSSINEGLFVLRPMGSAAVAVETELPDGGFTLLPSFPNPFNPQTTISLRVDRPQHIRVAVFDVQGKEVAELFSGFAAEAGTRELVFDATGLASGVYLVRAYGDAATRSTTVTLQK